MFRPEDNKMCRILGSHSDGYEEYYWNITPCSPLNVNGVHGVISQKIELFMIKGDHILYSVAKNLDCNFVKDPIPTSYSSLFIYTSPNSEPVRHC
jgi:hypothetical protein